ncbi:hypothetical protein MIND_00409200 [Mycena indigotica]|uniref:Uncharacterized protein n=1 Tax=Mycena indigotica TaxID=2126181 RepID=A0A8H6WBA7_9AGAR|nr:uncharacterized protein MIND_00409200 [Mycena indigotica]KAF7306189.1 hypothetical protein MIND_00409200 [Mycena indigotica]
MGRIGPVGPTRTVTLLLSPEKHYSDNKMIDHIYYDMHTGKWWWSTQRALEKLKPGATIIPIIISTDKTQKTMFRNKAAYPIYPTIVSGETPMPSLDPIKRRVSARVSAPPLVSPRLRTLTLSLHCPHHIPHPVIPSLRLPWPPLSGCLSAGGVTIRDH